MIELMSPAGNIHGFLNAINNGADSVYLGLQKFNARKPASNFSIYQLKKVIDIAHNNNKKIYLAFNIDLKTNELKEVSQILELASELKIDAIIVKDPALIYLIQKFYNKKLSIHYSTQNAICSSLGVKFAKSQGANRVILARELEINEIKEACLIDNIDSEMFVEGSMCFSISGRCLMSSWVGGRSGNRGVCTAPCRVAWEINNKKYPYFSMKDLSLMNSIDKIKKLKIAALKIEGRLKNALWVGEVTSIYKKALDNPDNTNNLACLYEELKKYSAREISEGHIYNHNNLIGENEDWKGYQKPQGKIVWGDQFKDENKIKISADEKNLKIIIYMHEKSRELYIKIPTKPKKAKPVLINSLLLHLNKDNTIIENKFNIKQNEINICFPASFIQKVSKTIINHIRARLKEEEKLPELKTEILNFIHPVKQSQNRNKILGDYPDKIIIFPDKAPLFLQSSLPVKTIVISLEGPIDIQIVNSLKNNYKVILSIPAVLYEKEAKKMAEYIVYLNKNSFDDFEANSYTGMQILKNIDCNKSLGTGMTVMNHISAKYFYDLGYSSLYSSIEGDASIYKSLSAFASGNIECMVFGKTPLFQSRVDSPAFINNACFKDKFNIQIECFKQKQMNIFVSKNPFSLIGEKIKKENIYFDSLSADLRYYNKPLRILESIFNDKFNNFISTFNFFKKLV